MINSYVQVIKNLGFRRLWLAQVVSQIAWNMLVFVLAINVYQATHTNIAVSLMTLAFGIPSVFFGIIAGGIVDYLDKRTVLVVCNFLRVIILMAFFFFHANIIAVYIFIILISVITQFFIPAEAPSIPVLVAESEILTANSLFTVSYYLSTVTGFILAGPMIYLFGQTNVYLFMSFLMLLSVYFVAKIPKIKPEKSKNTLSGLFEIGDNIKDGIRFIKSNKRIEQSLILMTFSQALIATLAVLSPGFSDKILGIRLTDASYMVMGPAAVGLIIGAVIVGGYGKKYLKGSIILMGILATAVILIFMSFISSGQILPKNLFFDMSLLFLLGVSNSFISVPSNTILQQDSENNMRGRVYGVLTSLTSGVSLLPVFFSAVLADILGMERALFILGLVVLIIGLYEFIQRKTVI